MAASFCHVIILIVPRPVIKPVYSTRGSTKVEYDIIEGLSLRYSNTLAFCADPLGPYPINSVANNTNITTFTIALIFNIKLVLDYIQIANLARLIISAQ